MRFTCMQEGFTMKLEKSLKLFIAVNSLIIVLMTVNSTVLNFFHGIIQAFFGGNAITKTFIFFISMIFFSLISFALLKTKKNPFKDHSRKLLIAMVFFAVLVLVIGYLQLYFFALSLQANYPIGTVNKEMTNWEATTFYHNHITKGSIYFLMTLFGIKATNFDNGQPFYEIQQYPEIFASAILLLLLLALIFGLLHINSMLDKISFTDFFFFNLGLFGLINVSIDGGLGSTFMLLTILFLSIYFSRNFIETENKQVKDLMPLMITAIIPIAISPLYNVYALSDKFTAPLLVVVGIGYFLWQQQIIYLKNTLKPLNILLIFLFILFLPAFFSVIIDFGFGIQVYNFSSDFTKNYKDGNGNGLFIYGIPRETTKEKLDLIISGFGKIEESYKMGWLAYYRITPLKEFRSCELEEILKKELKPKTYLYVEPIIPIEHQRIFIIHWLENKNESGIIEKDFFGITIKEKEDIGNKTFLKTRSKLSTELELLAILTKIRLESSQKIAVSFMS